MSTGLIRLALPKGTLLSPTSRLLNELTLGVEGYSSDARRYRLHSTEFSYITAKIFQEKDIPIQVAIGNYDLGICGADWVEELLARYLSSSLVKILNLNYGKSEICLVSHRHSNIPDIYVIGKERREWRIVSEYPNLAEAFALNLRLRDFKVFPVWGSAEVYLPEDAELAVLKIVHEQELVSRGFVCLRKLFPVTACLIANRESLENRGLHQILSRFASRRVESSRTLRQQRTMTQAQPAIFHFQRGEQDVRVALPDGHQQVPTARVLKQAGLELQGYSTVEVCSRPGINLDWASIKVIRPQDMPLQVANGNFDLAITGEDWFREHIYHFPASPVKKLLDLGFGQVKIVAAVNTEVPVANIAQLRRYIQNGAYPCLRVASEYINIADRYLQDQHIGCYKLILTWGASEVFPPEDADLLIDNVQTGRTLIKQNLKVIDILFQSQACLIGNTQGFASRDKMKNINFIIRRLEKAVA